jgi:hypothetical protein
MNKDRVCWRSKRIVAGLVRDGLVPSEKAEVAYDSVCRVLNSCWYCAVSLIPGRDAVYCDSSACTDKANDEEEPPDD